MCKLPVASLCVVLLSCAISSQALFCWMNAKDDFNVNHPLLLQANSNDFFYPQKCNSKDMKLKFLDNLRVACPDDKITVSSQQLKVSETNLRCYGLSYFEVEGQQYPTEINQIACSRSPLATAEETRAKCPNNGNDTGIIARVGFELASSVFLPTIEEICFDKDTARTHWAHSKVVMSVRKRQKESPNAPLYQAGELFSKVDGLVSAYTKEAQRKRLQELTMNETIVDKYIPANGSDYLVEGMLAPWADMFYRTQQESTYHYLNTVPMWKSIHEGNWKLVEDIVRKTTGQQCTNLDVWTGGFQNFTVKDNMNMTVDFTLAKTVASGMPAESKGAVPVPRFVYKYVMDQVRNRGIVFVTLNDPKATAIAPEDQICKPRDACSLLYPQFLHIKQGYTYCCSIDSESEFYPIADKLGLPRFPNALPLV